MLYGLPPSFILPRLLSFLLGQPRALRADFHALFDAADVRFRVPGVERIPGCDAFIAIVNHFHSPDMPALWMAAAVMLAIADRRSEGGLPPPAAIIATQWTYPDRLRQLIIGRASRLLFSRIMSAYGFLGMEPPSLGDAALDQRARSIRRVVEAARAAKHHNGVLMIAPEGGDAEGGVMARPPAGAGRFLALLGATGLPFLPIGAWAEGKQIVVSVGQPYCFADALRSECAGTAKDTLDECALRVAMGRVAALLPPHLRGYYG